MRHILLTIGILGMFLSSCQNQNDVVEPAHGEGVRLSIDVENNLLTRTPYTGSTPSADNPLTAAVWASTTENIFRNENKNGGIQDESNPNGDVAMFTEANFTSTSGQLIKDIIYPQAGKPVYFIAFHPATGWNHNPDGHLSAFSFSGCEDVMFAPQIQGEYVNNVTKDWPTLKFHHLLTWLRVCVKAESDLVSEDWGRIKSLKVRSRNTVAIEFEKEYFDDSNNTDKEKFEFLTSDSNSDATLDFFKTGYNEVFVDKNNSATWYTIPSGEKYTEVAYVLCEPKTATAEDATGKKTYEYTLLIETENRTVEVPVDLMKESKCFEGYTRKNQFILNLTFKKAYNVSVSATITDWRAGGMGLVDLDPNVTPKQEDKSEPGNQNTIDI